MQRILLAGLPGAGKTSYLAALWDSLNSEGNRSLTLVEQPANRRYLEEARARLQRLEPPIRNTRTLTSIDLKLATSDASRVDVEVPDVAGDFYQDFWETREWSVQFAEVVASISAVMLFLHSSKVATPISLDDIGELATAAGARSNIEVNSAEVPWEPKLAPDQVKLVDVLQMIESQRGLPGQLRLALVISAWDRVHGMSPDQWLIRSAPLIAQYLQNSAFWSPTATFGISAQGGDFEHDKERLVSVRPSQRVRVAQGASTGTDITIPLNWLIGRNGR